MTPLIEIKKYIKTIEERMDSYESAARAHERDNPNYASTMRDRIHEMNSTLIEFQKRLELMMDVVPRTGVVAWDKVDYESISSVQDIPIGWNDALLEHVAECTDRECRDNNHENALDGMEDLDHLHGDWIRDPQTGKYDVQKDGPAGFAAIKREFVYQIVWSRTTTRVASLCSPCYPNQADLDSAVQGPEGILAYTLPLMYFNIT